MTEEFDLLVVGAGPAGAAAALEALATRPDARVGLIDRAKFPRDKVCGDGITAGSVATLRRLGATAVLDGFAPVEEFRLTSPSGQEARATTGEASYVVPRYVLDSRLFEAAVSRGAEPLTGKVTEVEQDGDRVVVNQRWSARCVVGADGANSVVRRQIGESRPSLADTGVAMRGYASVLDGSPRMEIWFPPRQRRTYAWLFTEGAGTANVGFIDFDGAGQTNRQALVGAVADQFPDLDVDGATLRAHLLPLSTDRPAPATGRVLLAGDAASLVNPLTGEGIHAALLSGALAGRAAVTQSDAPAVPYQAELDNALSRHFRHTSAAARALKNPRMVDAAVASVARRHRVAHEVISMVFGTGSLSRSAAMSILARFSVRAITAR